MAGKTELTDKEKVETRSAATASYQPSLDRKETFRAFVERTERSHKMFRGRSQEQYEKQTKPSQLLNAKQQSRKSAFSNNQPENLIQLAAGAQLWEIQSRIDTTR